jgi:hypothetical protein
MAAKLTNSDIELPNSTTPTPQPAGYSKLSNRVTYAGLRGTPSHLSSDDHIKPSVESYQAPGRDISAQCIQCFQCRQPITPSGGRSGDGTDENTGNGSVGKIVPF